MDTPTGEALAGKRWWPDLRGAYGIPESMTPQNALEQIAAKIVADFAVRIVTYAPLDVGKFAAWIVVTAGERGGFDHVPSGDEPGIKRACAEVSALLSDDTDLQGLSLKVALPAAAKVKIYTEDPGSDS